MKNRDHEIEDLAFVDSSGKLIDGTDFAYLNLRFPQLERLMDDIMRRKKWSRLIFRSMEGLGNVWIRRLDSSGNFWKVYQEKEEKEGVKENPSIRFLYLPEEGVIRPVDYADPFVQLDGNRRTSQLLIASFLTHWLSGVLLLAEERYVMKEFEEVAELEGDLI